MKCKISPPGYLLPRSALLHEAQGYDTREAAFHILVASPLGRRAVRQCAENRAMPEATRAYARELMARSTSSLLAVSFSSDATLRKERRELMGRPISDESLLEFERLTAKLRPGKAD